MTITIDANWLASRLDYPNIVIIDAREIIQYRFRHIKNARPLGVESVISVADNGANLVIDAPSAEKLFSSLGIDDSKKVVVYGESIDPSAARIVWTLMYHGHLNVKLLDIGFNRWQQVGFPVTREVIQAQRQEEKEAAAIASSVGPPQFKSKINPTIRAEADCIKTKQIDSNVVIIDARTPQEHFQARIPGSILDNWEEGIGANGEMIKSKAELQKDFEEQGITKDKEIICYCHLGTRASHKYLQLKQAGYDRVRVYDGSIIDWAQHHNPIR
ncbi:MAG: rhodanese-like domain-containing protein [Candidatus Nitrosopolaris sp.]